MIYADHNSTSPIHELASLKMLPFLNEEFGNPSSAIYPLGLRAKRAVEQARENVALLLDASPSEVVFVSGGSESCFQAVYGSLLWHIQNTEDRSFQFVSTLAEHSAVSSSIETAKSFKPCLESLIELHESGELKLEDLTKLIADKQTFLSVMAANNETGVCYPIKKIASMIDSEKVIFHSDVIQLVGKKDFSFKDSGLDLASISSHKIGGPKGIGALLIKKNSRWSPPMQGGGQECGRRGGTLAVANIVGFGEAARIKKELLLAQKISSIARSNFEENLKNALGEKVHFVGDSCERLCNTSNVIFDDVSGSSLVEVLADKDICISRGSACKTFEGGFSKVHLAMGLSERESRCSVRVSFAIDALKEEGIALADEMLSQVLVMREAAASEIQNLII